MSETVGWLHPVDGSDQWDGFNEPGIEHFAGHPIKSLAREVNQNSLDALDQGDIVTVKIQLNKVRTEEIPNIDELRANLVACLQASKRESRKAEIFFQNAVNGLNKKTIPVLEISDYNTTGMRGPSSNGTPFYAFMKAKGQSKKESEDAGGSYGIGKLAPYAVSKLRTIFLSTVYEESPGKYVQLTQGKSILMSHDKDQERKQGVGFWGVKKRCQPVQDFQADLPSWILRATSTSDLAKSKGSKLSVLFFDDSSNWQERLAISVAENFFGAILAGKLRVEIDSNFSLDQTTITDFFQSDGIRGVVEIENRDALNNFDNCSSYLSALKDSPEVITESSQMQGLGLCQVKILLGEDLPRKVCFLRNGMFITDTLNGLKSFSDFKGFVAVFHCQNKKGNELLRAMEPPRHDGFEPERLPTTQEQRQARQALNKVSKWVRNMLKRHAKDPVSEVTTLDELKDFFYEEGDGDQGKGTEEVNPYGEVKLTGKPVKPASVASATSYKPSGGHEDGDEDGGGGEDGEGGGGDGKGGNGPGEGGASGAGKAHGNAVPINNVRALIVGNNSRRVFFTPVENGRVSIYAKRAGADSDFDISIIDSSKGEVKDGGVSLDVVAGERLSLDIVLNKTFSGAMKVMVYEI